MGGMFSPGGDEVRWLDADEALAWNGFLELLLSLIHI